MKRRLQFIFAIFAVGYYVGCAPAHFDTDDSCGADCVTINGIKTYRYSITPNTGKVDILFVDDNSASMSTEQNAMASRFSTFISTLNSKNVDYRIAITTTDLEKTPGRGQLIQFSSGESFLTNSSANKESLFASAIKRQETLACESFLKSHSSPSDADYQANCPSSDERGIAAALSVVRNNPAGFIRAGAQLAIIFVSDEDERSQLYDKVAKYGLADEDLPQTLIAAVQSTYSGKSLSIHALIVRPGSLSGVTAEQAAEKIASARNSSGLILNSGLMRNLFQTGDTGCLNTQSTQTNNVSGSFGYLYALAARLTGGVEGNICASDYAAPLQGIGKDIGDKVSEHLLHCSNPQPLDGMTPIVQLTPAGGKFTVAGNQVQFDPNLVPGTTALLQYTCP